MKTWARWLTPTHWIYLLVHMVVFLLGLLLIYKDPKDTVAVAIGTSLVSAGIVGWVVFAYVGLTQEKRAQLDTIGAFGLVTAFEGRAAKIRAEYDVRVKAARQHIDVLGFGLRALREDYADDFPSWASRTHVRILLVDPEFPTLQCSFASQRDLEEGTPEGTIRMEVLTFLRANRRIIGRKGGRGLEIRLYRCIPAVNVFRVDSDLFWGPYLMRQASRNTPTFLVRQGGVLFDRLAEHFERIWTEPELSRDVPAAWYEDRP